MTALLQDVRIGSQRPRLHSCPPFFSSLGKDKIDLAAHAGLELDPWQQYVIEETSGLDRRGKYAALEVGLLVPRQNGKGGIIEADQLGAMFLTKDEQIIYSAHQFKTAKAMYRRIRDLVQQTPDLHRLVRGYRQSNEETGIELPWGRLNFFARSNGSGRGFSGKKLYFDEAYNLDPELIADMLPTLSAMDSPQVWYCSSAGMAASEQLAKIRARGIRGDRRLAFYEWSSPPDADLDSDDALYEANPAMGIRLDPEFVRAVERPSMDDEQFGRERLGIWADPGDQQVISDPAWRAIQDPATKRAEGARAVFAAEVDIDQTSGAIGVATVNAVGKVHLETVAVFAGNAWQDDLVARAVDIYKRRKTAFLVADGGPADGLIPVLRAAGVEVDVVGTSENAQACASLVDAVKNKTVATPADGQKPLVEAVRAGSKRNIGPDGRWVWRRSHPSSKIAPLVAVTLAHYGWLAKPEPKPKQLSSFYGF